MDCALGRNADVAVQSADQELADLAGTPMGLVALGRDDQALDLPRQLVVSPGPISRYDCLT